ncbi:hypothetical protein LXA43DRAFT_892436, partial [Ganoderma leucocontextum]
TYANAQKLRAAISHKFGRGFKLGTQMWEEDPETHKCKGNPSLSVRVSEYMISLRRRRVRQGEQVTSARAIDHHTMKKLWEFNTSFPRLDLEPQSRGKRKAEPDRSWGGYNTRQMLHALYVVSMLCLLRYDEALRIMWHDIEFTFRNNKPVAILTLPFRKTHQNGECAPFTLWPNPEQPWMDGVMALATWWEISRQTGIIRDGYVFRSRRHRSDEMSARPQDAMSSKNFLQCFRNNLLDINIDPRLYGTHSFRRGGCQYLHTELRWPMRKICDWGGWAEDFDNPGTIFRYLLSWVDSPHALRSDYFNPDRPGTDPCTSCGRTCHCA